MDTQKVNKIWQVIKTIVEVILAALGGLAAGTVANAAGLPEMLASLL